jgi:hypothetical protein
MRPNPSPRPPAATISVIYGNDREAGAAALLAVLRPSPPPDALAPDSELREDPDSAEPPAEQLTAV